MTAFGMTTSPLRQKPKRRWAPARRTRLVVPAFGATKNLSKHFLRLVIGSTRIEQAMNSLKLLSVLLMIGMGGSAKERKPSKADASNIPALEIHLGDLGYQPAREDHYGGTGI